MKKAQNLKIWNNWKTLTLLVLLAGAGCKNNNIEHKNVYCGVVEESDKTRSVLIRDVQTGDYRVVAGRHRPQANYKFDYDTDLTWYRIGDTVGVKVSLLHGDDYYTDQRVLSEENIVFYNDSIKVRRERAYAQRQEARIDTLKHQLGYEK